MIFAVVMMLPLALTCSSGKVDQGRVVKFDKDNGTVTIIRKVACRAGKTDYRLPAVVYTMPDRADMEPEPKPGERIKLDTRDNQITYYDSKAGKLKTIPYTLIDQKENVDGDSPLVFDASSEKARNFPVVDTEKKTITVYSSRQKILTTFSLPEEYFSLPEYTWDAGDDVRIYYMEEGKALGFVNVTESDIHKKLHFFQYYTPMISISTRLPLRPSNTP